MLQFWTGVPLWLLAPILGPEEAAELPSRAHSATTSS